VLQRIGEFNFSILSALMRHKGITKIPSFFFFFWTYIELLLIILSMDGANERDKGMLVIDQWKT
jgi:hypothetical protein